MFLTRGSNSGGTTNLNRKRRRRPTTSPVAGRRSRPSLEALETRQLLSLIKVNTALDDNTPDFLSLRQAIEVSNGTLLFSALSQQQQKQVFLSPNSPSTDIVFNIPASTDPSLDIPVQGFDPSTQDWTITLSSPLPAITSPVTIDGYSQGEFPIPFVYPLGGAAQTLVINGNPTGGYFTLTTSTPLPVATVQIQYLANSSQMAAQIGAALQGIVGVGNVTVIGGGVPNTFAITFEGIYAGDSIPLLIASSNLTGGTNPNVTFSGTPVEITSTPNTVTAIDGNNAESRVIIDGSQINTTTFPDPTGFVLDASHSTLRGLIIDGFGVGVSVPQLDSSGNPNFFGDSIQGNFIGKYLEYPVDPNTGAPLPSPDNVELKGIGNTQGVVLNSNNTTVGGTNPQEDNVISGNVQQGVLIQPSATGNVVEGNQIGIVGPSSNGRHFQSGNGAEGILDYGSSNEIGGPVPAAGNLISANHSHGIRISGPVATRTIVAANIIGLGSGGGYVFGTGNPGNGDYGDGVLIEGSSDNQIGGPTASWGNTISSNFGSGVLITDLGSGASVARSIGNTILNNLIGVTADGSAAKGNAREGVADYSPGTVVGPGNVISGNLVGVPISGPNATGVVVRDNLIGTDITGQAPLANETDGVVIDMNASGNTIGGTVSGAGNTIAFNVLAGVSVESGTGDSILSNSIYSNGQLGIDLVTSSPPPGPNDLQTAPVLTNAVGGGPSSGIQGTLASIPATPFLIQFFTSLIPGPPSGFGQGQTPIGSSTVTTDYN